MADELFDLSDGPLSGTERAIRVRKQLRARRKELKMSQLEVAELIRVDLGWDSLTKQAISNWENFKDQPSIDAMAAWGRALGLQMKLSFIGRDDPRVMVPVRRESAEIIERFEALKDDQRAAVTATILAFSGK
jgi:transcriptional regulator with XRE-family HTH domain